jgi:cytoskeletal protein CcmA (bactofilin family)
MATASFQTRKDVSTPFSSNASSSSGDSSGSCVISQGTKIEGNFQSSENVRLDGEVLGDFSCEKKLVIGRDGRVEGSIHAREAMIMGFVNGDIDVSGLLQLDKTAQVKGNIKAGSLAIEDGARFDGICGMKK